MQRSSTTRPPASSPVSLPSTDRRLRATTATALLAMLATATHADAHAVGVSRGEYRFSGTTLTARLAFARGELTALLPASGADPRRAEIGTTTRQALERGIVAGVVATAHGNGCAGTLESARLVQGDGIELDAAWRCDADADFVSVELRFVDHLPFGHRHLADVGGSSPIVTFREHASFEVERTRGGPTEGSPILLRMGAEHVLTGWDHLVFLVGLILVGRRWRSLAAALTAFTVGHSISLALVTLGAWAPSPRFVEPAIALSIAYVGAENLLSENVSGRWKLTFPFGLVHGFGFAGALREVGLARTQFPVALFTFNLGVEVAQLAVLAAVLPVVLWLGPSGRAGTRGVRAASVAILAAGAVCFVARVIAATR